MDNCSTNCQKMAKNDSEAMTPQIQAAAERLACLLTDTAEFQNFVRLARGIRIDQEVSEILFEMDALGEDDHYQKGATRTLQTRLEALPIMRSYRQAEEAARVTFTAVDDIISDAAGLAFAEFAQSSGCG